MVFALSDLSFTLSLLEVKFTLNQRMSTLPKAPLLEVGFSIIWGKLPADTSFPKLGVNSTQMVQIHYNQDEVSLFPVRLATELQRVGFSKFEALPNLLSPQGMVQTMRFLSPNNPSQAIQSGMGIFSIHHGNDGYDWSPFKDLVMKGTSAFLSAFPNGFSNSDLLAIELRYVDGLPLSSDEDPFKFLEKTMELSVSTPQSLASYPGLNKEIAGSRINYGLRSNSPEGMFVIDLAQGTIPSGSAYILNTSIRSSKNEGISITPEFLSIWLDRAHVLEKFSFKSMIKSEHARTVFT